MPDIQWTPPTQAQLQAAEESVNAIVELLRTERGVHAETAIAGAARVAGTFLFRSFKFPDLKAEPGSAVFSDKANEHGPLLVQTLGAGLNALNVPLQPGELTGDVPEENKPHLSVTATQKLLESPLRAIAAKHGLTDEQGAHACALAAARLMQKCADILNPKIGFSIAAYGFVEGSKTMPAPLQAAASAKRPWYKLWQGSA